MTTESRMNEWLAQAYGTNGAGRTDSDLEKTAQALMLNKLAEQENIDLSGLDEQQLALLAQEVSQQMAMQQQGGEQQGGGMPGPPGMPGMQGGPPPMGAMPGMPAAGGGMPMAPPSAQSAQQPPPMPNGAGPGPQAPQEGGFSEEQIKVAQAKMAEADFLGRMMAHALHQELGIIKQAEFPNAGGGGGGSPFPPKAAPPFAAQESEEEKRKREEEEAEKTAFAYLAARGYAVTKHASAEGPLTRAIRALGGTTR